nr:MAG TPA: hypothetical protein [Caudoviricetes sp.]
MWDSLHKNHIQQIPEDYSLGDLFYSNLSTTFVVQTN